MGSASPWRTTQPALCPRPRRPRCSLTREWAGCRWSGARPAASLRTRLSLTAWTWKKKVRWVLGFALCAQVWCAVVLKLIKQLRVLLSNKIRVFVKWRWNSSWKKKMWSVWSVLLWKIVTAFVLLFHPSQGYGFQPQYNGDELSCTLRNLRRSTAYKFRVCTVFGSSLTMTVCFAGVRASSYS